MVKFSDNCDFNAGQQAPAAATTAAEFEAHIHELENQLTQACLELDNTNATLRDQEEKLEHSQLQLHEAEEATSASNETVRGLLLQKKKLEGEIVLLQSELRKLGSLVDRQARLLRKLPDDGVIFRLRRIHLRIATAVMLLLGGPLMLGRCNTDKRHAEVLAEEAKTGKMEIYHLPKQ